MQRVAWGALVLFVLAALLVALRRLVPALRARLRLWRPSDIPPDETDRLVTIYQRFLKALERHGIRRQAALTPLEFASQAGALSGRAGEIHEITTLFCRARYGGSGLSTTEVHRIESLITLLKN